MSTSLDKAYAEWARDAIRDTAKMPNRFEAFRAGWEAAIEAFEVVKPIRTEQEIRQMQGRSE